MASSPYPFRLKLILLCFGLVYLVLAAKLIFLGKKSENLGGPRTMPPEAVAAARPDILDRHGEPLATDVKITSVFAEPRRLVDRDEALELLLQVLPDLDEKELRERFKAKKGFVWVKRGIKPQEEKAIFNLGLPGIGFLTENKRIYPNGPLGAHILGFTNLDNAGIAGIEKYIDTQGLAEVREAGLPLESLKPIVLSLDLRATHALREELIKGVQHFKAKAGAALLLDVTTGEVIALASIPDFDPNVPVQALDSDRINRLVVGVFEMGSTFKALSIAMALDSRKVTLKSRIDARNTLRYGRYTIKDFRGQGRPLTIPEVLRYSSNIGTARLALLVGVEGHKAFLKKMGLLTRLRTELPESAEPIVPRHWGELNTVTISYGHGLSVAPLQATMAVAALVNDGILLPPTFLKRTAEEAKRLGKRVISSETSESMRYIMRWNAEVGSARFANVPGYFVGGKTGTSEKVIQGRYSKTRNLTTFFAFLPAHKPKYLFLTLLDEPQALPETYGFATAAWNAGRVTAKIIERLLPVMGVAPDKNTPLRPFPRVRKIIGE